MPPKPTEIPYEQAADSDGSLGKPGSPVGGDNGGGGGSDKASSSAVPPPPVMVHVVAPATLPAGYTFEAQIGGDPERTFAVEVPEGGVKEGETFLAPLPQDLAGGGSGSKGLGPRIRAPTGMWKDGLCDFCSLGPCHAHFCCALCCTQIAMGQLMQRMRLTWLGVPGPDAATRNTFKVVLALVIAYTVYSSALEMAAMPPPGYSSDDYYYVPPLIPALKLVGSVLFTAWAIYALCRARESVRATYSIPEGRCNGCEDLCCSAFCSCCVVAQMLRHTGEYETYPGVCCTQTGHDEDAPPVV